MISVELPELYKVGTLVSVSVSLLSTDHSLAGDLASSCHGFLCL